MTSPTQNCQRFLMVQEFQSPGEFAKGVPNCSTDLAEWVPVPARGWMGGTTGSTYSINNPEGWFASPPDR